MEEKQEITRFGTAPSETIATVGLARRMRGYDVEATDALIRRLTASNVEVSAMKDELERECAALREQVARLQGAHTRNREREEQVSRALIEAKSHAAEIRNSARCEAETVLRKARAESKKRAERAERVSRELEEAERELERLWRIQAAVQIGLAGFLTEVIEQLRSEEEAEIDRLPSTNDDGFVDVVPIPDSPAAG